MNSTFRREHHEAVLHLFFGHRAKPLPCDLDLSWRAVKAVATGDGVLSDLERNALVGLMTSLLTPPDMMDAIMDWEPAEISAAEVLAQLPEHRRQAAGLWVVYHGLKVAVADGELAPGELESVRAVARSMDVDPDSVRSLYLLVADEAAVRRRRMDLLTGAISGSFHLAPDSD